MAKETNWPDPPKGHIAIVGWDAVNKRWQAAAVDAAGLLQTDVADAVALQANAHGYDGSAWKKLPLLWGYTDTYSEAQDENYTSTGFKVLQTDVVPPGSVYVVTGIGAYYNTGTITDIKLYLTMGAGDLPMAYDPSPAVDVPLNILGSFPLKASHRVKAGYTVTVQPCHCYLVVVGYEMEIDM